MTLVVLSRLLWQFLQEFLGRSELVCIMYFFFFVEGGRDGEVRSQRGREGQGMMEVVIILWEAEERIKNFEDIWI